MKTFLSLKPGATFFLGSSRTLVYHKENVEFVYRMKVGNKPIYAHIYEISSHCPLKLWKDRLLAVWGEETK